MRSPNRGTRVRLTRQVDTDDGTPLREGMEGMIVRRYRGMAVLTGIDRPYKRAGAYRIPTDAFEAVEEDEDHTDCFFCGESHPISAMTLEPVYPHEHGEDAGAYVCEDCREGRHG